MRCIEPVEMSSINPTIYFDKTLIAHLHITFSPNHQIKTLSLQLEKQKDDDIQDA